MKRSFVLYQHILERLTKDSQLETIILGTGELARDLQAKLRLLNLKAPFLVGGQDDLENGIWHYERLAALEHPERYQFIICFDVNEWTFIAPAQSTLFKLLGIASYNHPRVIRLTGDPTLYEKAGDLLTDAHIQNIILKNNRPYALFGDGQGSTFRIHILGGSTSASIFSYSQFSWPELLHTNLCKANFNAAVYSWGQPLETAADCLLQFLRDGYQNNPDLVILYKGEDALNPLRNNKRNILPVRIGAGSHEYTRQTQSIRLKEHNTGLDHETDISEIWSTQHRVFMALSKLLGFSFWNIIAPIGVLLPAVQSGQLLGLSSGYLARARQRRDTAVSMAPEGCVKDYTDSFEDMGNIFTFFADITHLTDQGNQIIAERCAKDIIDEFGVK